MDSQKNSTVTHKKRSILLILTIIVLLFFLPAIPNLLTRFILTFNLDKLSIFKTIFLGIFIEAVPFLLLGTLASGIVEVFVNQDALERLIPKNPIAAALVGSMMGLIFPVCECGIVPLVRRLFAKGLPIPAGIALLLAGPVFNPIVILSTAAAFGFGKVLWLRLLLSLMIAFVTGMVFNSVKDTEQLLKPIPHISCHIHHHAPTNPETGLLKTLGQKTLDVLRIALGEFFEMGKFLIIGGLLAAFLQTFVAQTQLSNLTQNPILSVLALMVLAVVLSICSTVDSFIALSFINTFNLGAVISFLVFGPMVDIKSALMYWNVFRDRAPLYLILIPFLMSLIMGILINLVV